MKRFLLAISLVAALRVAAQPVEVQTAATNALATLAQLTTSRNFDKLGFATTNDTSHMTLGGPFPLYVLGSPQVFHPSAVTNANSLFLLTNVTHYLYPVIVSNQVRTSFTIQKHGNQWRGTAYGDADFVRLLVTTQTNLLAPGNPALATSFAVRVPPLGAQFLGYTGGQDVQLTLLAQRASLDSLAVGSPTNANRVLGEVRTAIDEKSGFPE